MEKHVSNIPQMYAEMMFALKMTGIPQPSERGTVLALRHPVMITVSYPTERVLLDPVRMANPFFHVAEAVWMMAGHNDTDWLSQFNKGITNYADEDGTIHGAYGTRWQSHFSMDQLRVCAGLLRRDVYSRRAVLQMWDPQADLDVSNNDIPCNTNIYFRVINGALGVTVCNRSNDVIWGMCGANAVHLTIMQEVMAGELDLEVGPYTVMSNNAHVYMDLPNVLDMLKTQCSYRHDESPMPIMGRGDSLSSFVGGCRGIIQGKMSPPVNRWLRGVAVPMIEIYLKEGDVHPNEIMCPQWRRAAKEWLREKRT